MKLWGRFLMAALVALALGLATAHRSIPERRSAWNAHTLTGKLYVKKMLA